MTYVEYGDEIIEEVQLSPSDPRTRVSLRWLIEKTVAPCDAHARSVRTHKAFARLSLLEKWLSVQAETFLHRWEAEGQINALTTRRILDFGAGTGASTLALTVWAENGESMVDAVEKEEVDAALIVNRGIVSPANLYGNRDGILRLNEVPPGTYDLVTAFWLGPDEDGELGRLLLEATFNAVGPSGKLLVTSDVGTIQHLKAACNELPSASSLYYPGTMLSSDQAFFPPAMVIGFSAKPSA